MVDNTRGTEANNSIKPSPKPHLIGRFAHHKLAANLLMLIMLLAGVAGLTKLNTQFLPSFALDYITVSVTWPGASSEDVSRSIVTPLEQELRNLDYVKDMRSISTRSYGGITLEYKENTDMAFALDQVKQLVSLVSNLPTDSKTPVITKIVAKEDVATLILTSESSLEELRPLAFKFERQLLERGVAKVEFTGLPSREIAIQVPSTQLKKINMSLPQIGQRIVSRSQDIPAGTVGKNDVARELRSVEQRRSEQGFRELALLTTKTGKKLSLGDIANVELRPKDSQVEVYHLGRPAILMRVLRTENADTLKSAAILHDWLEITRPSLTPGIELNTYAEAYILIEERIDLLLKNGLGGLILVVCILFIFLNGRVAFWVAWGIPVSFMGTLAILYLAGGSINMVSLFALIMALGIIVDDAIVVGEDAMTHYTMGESPLKAAEGGARRMFVPVMASSLTTIAAFIPLMLVSGIMGNILYAIPLTIVCVILASLVESFLILPGHLSHSFKRSHKREQEGKLRLKLDRSFERFREGFFRPLVTWSINNRLSTIVFTICLFFVAISITTSGQVKYTFFPQPESQIIIGSVKFSAGTPPETVRAFAHHMEASLRKTNDQLKDKEELVVHSVLRVNQATFDGGQFYSYGEQYTSLHIELTSPDSREIRNSQFIETWKKNITFPPGVEQVSISSLSSGPAGKDIDLFLYGQEPATLKKAGEELALKLKSYVGVNNIQDDLPFGKGQYIYELTPLGESLGLTVSDVGNQLRSAFDGQLLQVFYDANNEIEVRIVLPDDERNHTRALYSFPIITPSGKTTPLINVVSLKHQRGLEILRHTNGVVGIHITAGVDTTQNNANVIIADLASDYLPEFANVYGLRFKFEGKTKEQKQTGEDMMTGAVIGLMLTYIILAWVFSSYLWPMAIMVAIPFGATGAIIGHWVMGFDMSILSLFGIFGLSGIVMNDAIILVTFYKELRKKGEPLKEAIINASCLRLRAVMLTSLTTIAGLLPLLFETSLQAQFLIPMAISISFGLVFSTMLVLIVIPVILSLIEGARVKLSYHLFKPHSETENKKFQSP